MWCTAKTRLSRKVEKNRNMNTMKGMEHLVVVFR